ncbi:WW domain binding protein VOPP1-like [Lineus longissimus]|uniref:WW domain binding protein VOPP1-like n=1 Tax=Lineus longissimus TaxID=88925 RepID=UPI002B4D1E83
MASNMCRPLVTLLIVLLGLFSKTYAEICDSGIVCQSCCLDGDSCCYDDDDDDYYYTWNIWNMWYFWFIIIFVLLSCFGGCGYWRRRRILLQQRNSAATSVTIQPGVPVTAGAQPGPYFQGGYTNTSYGTPGVPQNIAQPPAMYNGPPAYTEVISKPDQYPQPPKTHPDGQMRAPYPTQPGFAAMPYQTGPDGGAARPPPYVAAPSSQTPGEAAPYPTQGQAPYPQQNSTPYPQQ